LIVDGPFARNDQISVLNALAKLYGLKHNADTRHKLGAQECDEPPSKPAGGARPGENRHVDAHGVAHTRREAPQALIERLDLLGTGALLRPVDGACSLRPDQGVVDIARDDKLRLSHSRVEPAEVDRAHPDQLAPARTHFR